MKTRELKIVNFHFPFWQAFYLMLVGLLCIVSYGVNGWFQLQSISKTVTELSISVSKTNDSIALLNTNLSEVKQKALDNADNIRALQNGRIHN